jgi:hypothetical protein
MVTAEVCYEIAAGLQGPLPWAYVPQAPLQLPGAAAAVALHD